MQDEYTEYCERAKIAGTQPISKEFFMLLEDLYTLIADIRWGREGQQHMQKPQNGSAAAGLETALDGFDEIFLLHVSNPLTHR